MLTETGRTVCLDFVNGTLRVVAEGVVLDEGRKIAALQRRGDRVYWTNDGVERSAPLPKGVWVRTGSSFSADSPRAIASPSTFESART